MGTPSYVGEEHRMVEAIVEHCRQHNYQVSVDGMLNTYVTKGGGAEGQQYPLFVAHTDTVHPIQDFEIVEEQSKHPISRETVETWRAVDGSGKPTGIGGDDKCGVFLCLSMLEALEMAKVAFFASEEMGCRGSSQCAREFMEDVAYVLQFDAPGNNRASRSSGGVDLFDPGFGAVVTPVLETHGYLHLLDDPFTDVMVLRETFGINCLNVACGYYEAHTDQEFVIPEDVFAAGELGLDLARALNRA